MAENDSCSTLSEKVLMATCHEVIKVRSYCAQCQSSCPTICTVQDGKLVKVARDRDHPNSTALCPKGLAAAELIYDERRLRYPLKRTRPKNSPDPGWERISWEEAMHSISQRLLEIKATHGAHAVAFNRPGPGGSPSKDYAEWMVRLAYCFGTPNHLATGHVCQWHRDTGSKYTYGWEKVPEPDFEQTNLLVLWGHNPFTSVRCNVRDITKVKKRGGRIVVIDPRLTEAARIADLWLPIRPGTDGALIMGLIRSLIEKNLYDEYFVKRWTNAPFLVRSDTGNLLGSQDLGIWPQGSEYVVWDTNREQAVRIFNDGGLKGCLNDDAALLGSFRVQLSSGPSVTVKPVFEILRRLAEPYTPGQVASITGVQAEKVEKLSEWITKVKPLSYYSYNGIEQHTNAMQTNRAICILYALTGDIDKPGGNVFFPSLSKLKIRNPKMLSKEVHELRLGYSKRPLGPCGYPNSSVQAYELFETLITKKPYSVKALISLGGNLVTANSHSLLAREALQHLEFFAISELFMTPTAELADIVLPATTCYESFHLKMGFPNLLRARSWIQYRPRVIPPLFEARSDLEIIFDLAQRLGLGDRFWGGDLKAAFSDQLKPLGHSLEDLERITGGMSVHLPMAYQKYAQTDRKTGQVKGFKTPSGRIDLFSQTFKDHGYDPLPLYREPGIGPISTPLWSRKYPLILTCSKLLYYCHGQHRSVPSLRRCVPHPFVEINPQKAQDLNIKDGEWVYVETPFGKIRLTAKVTPRVSLNVVCIQHGWWQSCPNLDLPGYDPYSKEGANANLLYSTTSIDEISGSVPYKAYVCKISKLSQ